MPLYGTPQAGGVLTAVGPGDSIKLFDSEVLVVPQASIAFARQDAGGGLAGARQTTFQVLFAAAPLASVAIQGSNVDIDAAYQDLAQIDNAQFGRYVDTGTWAYYRAVLLSQSAGGAVTVIAQR